MAHDRVCLGIEPLHRDQYRQVAEWEFGPQPDGTDWERYAREMEAPQWAHYGLYHDGELVGAVSLEKLGATMAAFHVVTARRAVYPNDLAQTLLTLAGCLFDRGLLALVAHAPNEKRAVARLALRCGMHEWGHDAHIRYFILTKARYHRGR